MSNETETEQDEPRSAGAVNLGEMLTARYKIHTTGKAIERGQSVHVVAVAAADHAEAHRAVTVETTAGARHQVEWTNGASPWTVDP